MLSIVWTRQMKNGTCFNGAGVCCSNDLGDTVLRAHPNFTTKSIDEALALLKTIAVVPVALGVSVILQSIWSINQLDKKQRSSIIVSLENGIAIDRNKVSLQATTNTFLNFLAPPTCLVGMLQNIWVSSHQREMLEKIKLRKRGWKWGWRIWRERTNKFRKYWRRGSESRWKGRWRTDWLLHLPKNRQQHENFFREARQRRVWDLLDISLTWAQQGERRFATWGRSKVMRRPITTYRDMHKIS